MKKLFIIFSGIFFAIQFVHAQYYNLTVGDPRNSWYTNPGSIEEAVVTLKPSGLFMEYGVYLTFSSAETSYDGNDTLEVVLDFGMPEEAMITDSWLWIEDNISRGILMDRWTASNIYEDIVDRRKDPSILTKNSAVQYQLRIFPMAGDQTRKVKITYLLPMILGREKLSVQMPWDIFGTSYAPLQNVDLIVWEDDKLSGLKIDYSDNIEFIEMSDTYLGKYQYAQLPNDKNIRVIYDSPLSEGYYLGTYSLDGQNGYYQLGVLPGKDIEDTQKHKIAFLLDLELDNCHCSLDGALDHVRERLMENLSPKDSFNFFFSGLQIGQFSDTWVAASAGNINAAINYAKENMATYSNLIPLMQKGLEFLNENYFEQGESMLLLSNADQYSNYITANELLDDILQIRAYDYPIHVLDYQSKNYDISWVGGIKYYGNEYFFNNLAHLTHGNFLKLRNSNYTTVYGLMGEMMNNLKGYIDHFELDIRLAEGYTYGRFELGNNKAYYIDDAIIQVGRYHGQAPFLIDLNGSFNEEFFNIQIQAESDDIKVMDHSLANIWGGLDLVDLENEYYQSNDIIAQVVEKSLDINVLSRYTAFLCLEDTSQYCDGCIDETDLVGVEETALMVDSLLVLYPNPFHEVLNIGFDKSILTGIKIQVTDLHGRTFKEFEEQDFATFDNQHLVWKADEEGVLPGVYFVRFIIGEEMFVKKVIKLE
jgi:Ca-activated chloride channel family protein